MDDELLEFPPETNEYNPVSPLTNEELVIVRKMIAEYSNKNVILPSESIEIKSKPIANSLFQSEEKVVKHIPNNLFGEESANKPEPSGLFFANNNNSSNKIEKSNFNELLDSCKNYDSTEADYLKLFKDILSKTEGNISKTLIVAILGIFPCKRFIRHGTPEQKLFVLKSLSDRFLENIAGLKFLERRKLLKIVAKYLSEIAEYYNFIPMEGEPFKPNFHERVTGSSSSGLVVKEMRGFLVTDSRTNRIIYTGLVLS